MPSQSRLIIPVVRYACFLIVSLACPTAGAAPVDVVFDTDMGNDVDDALALGLLHALESRGECRILAVALTKDHPLAASRPGHCPTVTMQELPHGDGWIIVGGVGRWGHGGALLPFRVARTAGRHYDSAIRSASLDVEGGIPHLSPEQRKVRPPGRA